MGHRERLRQEALEEIKTLARQQMAAEGTASLSLNAIARQMGMSGPALYRYYPSRDDLITTLIIDAYLDFARALEEAAERHRAQPVSERLMAVLLAYRQWSLDNPVDFQLIYGNPIPGYHAPEELTAPAATRGFALILQLLNEAWEQGDLRVDEQETSVFPVAAESGESYPPQVVYAGVAGWYVLHGMISLEIYGHTVTVLADSELFYRNEVENLLHRFGL